MEQDPKPVHEDDAEPRDPAEFDRMFVSLEKELKGLAESLFKGERRNHTLQRTALVNEAYMRLKRNEGALVINDRDHLFQIAANTLKRILIEHHRSRSRLKRGGDGQRAGALGEEDPGKEDESPALSAEERDILSRQLDALSSQDQRMADVVRLRILQGLSMAEIAKVLGCSERSAFNDWKFAKAKLRRALEESTGDPETAS